jgi:hemolysin activation/secretion protein
MRARALNETPRQADFWKLDLLDRQCRKLPGWRRRVSSILCAVAAGYAFSEPAALAAPFVEVTYRVSGYKIRGNTALELEAAGSPFTNAIGSAVPLASICKALASLRQSYYERGYIHASVGLSEQRLTNGVVVIDVIEGTPLGSPLSASVQALPPGTANSNRPAAATFEVRHFEVAGNTVLAPENIERILTPATGPAVTLEAIRKAAAALQRAYRERGYVTVAVAMPSQRLTNATVRLLVTEGTLAAVQVVGNRHFSSNNIVRALPTLHTNTLLNSHVLLRELDLANQNQDRQIYPAIGPGPVPGTSALALRVKDRLPLHANLELDNYTTPGTPDLRVNFAVQYNNLWQQEHQIGLAYSFSPQQFKAIGDSPNFGFNQPLISSYSAFYRMPVSGTPSVSEGIADSAQFGYQEATHQFRLPPARTQSELVFYASASSSDTGVKWGNPSVVSETSLLSIISQDSGENLTANQNVGSQFRFPLLNREHATWTAFVGGDFKHYQLSSFNTNNFFITTITTNLFGAETNRTVDSTNQPGINQDVVYFPLTAGLDLLESDQSGSTSLKVALCGNVAGNQSDFAKLAYSSSAKAVFVKGTLGASRDQKLPAGCSLLARVNGQIATGALINNEQLALGGINSVRGYYEGDEYGDCGWCGGVEMRSPYFQTPVAGLAGSVPAWFRASVFTDLGQRFLLEPAPNATSTVSLLGTGFGLSANVNNHLDARLVIAWPLLSTANTPAGQPHAYFTIGGQF